jgi:hypothetical protein
LAGRVELRRQKWEIKSLELQCLAAQSLTNPQLDFVSSYRVNGFGDRLFGEDDDDGVTPQGLASAYETLSQGDQTGWNLGFVFSMPLGFRSAHTQVRNYELRVARARAILASMEMDVAHGLATSFQSIAANYAAAQSNLNRQIAAQERVEILEKQREAGVLKADLVLRAQASRADAERAFYTSLIEYNQAITDFHYRKGTLLQHNNVYMAENQWTPEAYREAYRRAWARSHAFKNEHLKTEPPEFAFPGGHVTALPAGQSPPKERPLPTMVNDEKTIEPGKLPVEPITDASFDTADRSDDEPQERVKMSRASVDLGQSLMGRARVAPLVPQSEQTQASSENDAAVRASTFWAGDRPTEEPVESLDIHFGDE